MPKIFTRPGSIEMLTKPSLIGGKLYPSTINLDKFSTISEKKRSNLVEKNKNR